VRQPSPFIRKRTVISPASDSSLPAPHWVVRGRCIAVMGTTATFHFQRLSVFRGYGVGSLSRGSMSFAYGLTAEEAGSYLKLPEGKKLTHNGTELKLADL
jgi:hypothetical protein